MRNRPMVSTLIVFIASLKKSQTKTCFHLILVVTKRLSTKHFLIALRTKLKVTYFSNILNSLSNPEQVDKKQYSVKTIGYLKK